MTNFLRMLWTLFMDRLSYLSSTEESPTAIAPSPVPVPVVATPAPVVPPAYLFNTPQNARHSVRLICDEVGMPLVPTERVNGKMYLLKDVFCACIEQESQFYNYLPNGNPTKGINYAVNKDGTFKRDAQGNKIVSSTDWGICQVNDYWHIGPKKDFPSVDFVMANPEKAVRWAALLFKQGQADMWDSHKSGAYEKYLPQNVR